MGAANRRLRRDACFDLDKTAGYFDVAREESAAIAAGGKAAERLYVKPTLLTNAASRTRIAQEGDFRSCADFDPVRHRGRGTADRQSDAEPCVWPHSRPANVCAQRFRASHRHAIHTGRLSTAA